MNGFVQRHSPVVTGILSGFDRLIFRGYLLRLARAFLMLGFLRIRKIELREFGHFAERCSTGVKDAAQEIAHAAGRPVVYLASAGERKDEMAREMAKREGIEEGLVVVFKTLENCMSFECFGNAKTGRVGFKRAPRKCLHLYYYLQHPAMGLMHFRLQTWFPFSLQVYVNGREWLARTLTRHHVPYVKAGNCFTHIGDLPRAQEFFDAQLTTDWPALLEGLVKTYHPTFKAIFQDYDIDYHWSASESEWATDVMFKDTTSLARLYPRLTRHAISTFDSPSVLRFLGGHVSKDGQVHGSLAGPVKSGLKRFPDCVRVRHAAKGNAVKLYNKEGTVLRVETTISHPQAFKVYRSAEGGAEDVKAWRALRKGVADMKRRAEVSQACNERYLEALAAVDDERTLGELLEQHCQAVNWRSKRVRGLQPTGQDAALLKAISRGEFLINGLRNVDIRKLLYASPARDPKELRCRSGRITRQLRLLRAHGLLRKVPKTHRYHLTDEGRSLVTALTAATHASARKLMDLAA